MAPRLDNMLGQFIIIRTMDHPVTIIERLTAAGLSVQSLYPIPHIPMENA